MNTSLFKKAAVNASGVLAYVLVLTWFMNHGKRFVGSQPPEWIIGSLMLIVFVTSACITGGLVLGLPIMMYIDGQHRQAVKLLTYTVICLIVVVALLALGLVLL